MDWSAIDDDTYDGASDSNCPVGRGPTEQAAIDDLKEQIAERQGTCSHFTENCPICNPLEARHV
jgi:hypothetical protein